MILAIAVVFDPRYKIQFVEFCYKVLYGDNCAQISKLHETSKGLFDLYKDRIHTYTVVYESQSGGSLENQGLDVLKEFDALDNDDNSALEKTELDRYLEEKRLNRATEIDVLDYWSTNQGRFPNLALMARDVLTIPISTVASESAFSVGGRVLDQYRSCLAHNIVESLICTRDWKFNEEVYHNYLLEELTQDITRIDIKEDHDPTI
ncbi:hypothetical protein OROGR_027202 [Orobanche gracilis]